MKNQQEVLKKIALDSWNTQVSRASKMFEGFADEQMTHEIAPGRNSGVYLLGHLTAVHDAMLPLLGISERQYPELEEIFIKNPDKAPFTKPEVKELRERWNKVNTILSKELAALNHEQWFEKHTLVSEVDFKKEPHRNKLNSVLNRTHHLSYHLGQLVLLK